MFVNELPTVIAGQGESALTVKTQILEIVYFWKFDTKTPNLVCFTLVSINKVKGKFLFTFPHSSPNKTSALADSL
jgi:flagellar motor switch protein FliM